MQSSGDKNRIAAALDYLRAHDQFFEFDDQERVVRVGVSGATNVDEAAAHIGNLHALQELTFYGTGLSDRGFSHLAGLENLKELSIDGSGFTSSGLACLSAMPKLEDLYLRDARDVDLAALESIARVPRLCRLSLRGGSFRDADLEPLAALVSLERLSLTGNDNVHGTFCKHLMGLSRLDHLNLGERVTDEGLAWISRLSRLVGLQMGGPLTDAGLRHLLAAQGLEKLSIRSEQATAEGIAVVAQLPMLQSLDLNTPRLADDVIAALLRCSALEDLTFTRSALSDDGLQQLRAGMPQCRVGDLERDTWQIDEEDDQDADRPELDSRTPFEVLLAKARDSDLVNGTFAKIGARYGHWVDANQYTPEETVVMLVWHSGGIIGNGGIEHLFEGEFPGDPDYRITAESYRLAGIERSHKAFEAAFALFPGGVVPCDPEERIRLYEGANASAREAINRECWRDDRARARMLAKFIRKNAAQLGDLDAD